MARWWSAILAGRAGVGGKERWALAQLVRDVTASEWGGWNQVATLHGEGSLTAQLIESVRAGDVDACVGFVESILHGAAGAESELDGSMSTPAATVDAVS